MVNWKLCARVKAKIKFQIYDYYRANECYKQIKIPTLRMRYAQCAAMLPCLIYVPLDIRDQIYHKYQILPSVSVH